MPLLSNWTRFVWSARGELNSLERYLDFLNKGIKAEKEKQDKWLKQEADRLELDKFDSVYTFFHHEITEIEKEFPRRVFSSFIIGWFSTYEEILLSLCNALGLKLTVDPFELTNFKPGIDRVKRILEQASINLNNEQWREMQNIRFIRNKLAHNADQFLIGGKPQKGEQRKWQSTNLVTDLNLTFYVKLEKSIYKYLNRYNLLELHRGFGRLNPGYLYCEHLNKFATKSINGMINNIETQQPGLKQI